MDLSRLIQIMGGAIEDGHDDLPGRLCGALTVVLQGRGTSLALMADPAHHRLLAADHPQAAALSELEFALGEGPGLDAMVRGAPVLVGDLAGTGGERWPVWSAGVAGQGLPARALFAFPLQIDGTGFGLVEVFRDRPGTLAGTDAAAARIAADLTALALTRAFEPPAAAAVEPPDWLRDPSVDEVEVEQAIGMVMAQLRSPAEAALSMLRARAFAEGRLLGEVARDVLRRKISFAPGAQGDGSP